MATLWIHRAYGSDMLVRFPTGFEAYKFGTRFLKEYYSEAGTFIDSWDDTKYTKDGALNVGSTPSLQLSVHPGEFHSDGHCGLKEWAPRGTFIVPPEEAMALGEEGVNAEMKLEGDVFDKLMWETDHADDDIDISDY